MGDFIRAIGLLEEAILTHAAIDAGLEDVAQALGFDHFCFFRAAGERQGDPADRAVMPDVTTHVPGDWDVCDGRGVPIGRVRSGRLLLQNIAAPKAQDVLNGAPASSSDGEASYACWGAQIGDQTWVLALVRSAARGHANWDEIEKLRAATSAINRVLRLAHRIRAVHLNGMFNGLAAARSAAIAMSADGRVALATPHAERMFGLDFGIREGRLWSAHAASHAYLEALVDLLHQRQINSLAPFLIRRFTESHSIIAHPVALRGASPDIFAMADIAVFLITPDQFELAGENYLELLFGLTPAEAQIATMLAQGLEPQQIAERRKVSVGTTRVQIKNIFQKANVHRQAELIKIVCALSAPGHAAT